MHVRALALAVFVSFACSVALAQCGSNQLTTPPNFVWNGGSSPGGMMYFTLDVTAGNGIRICGIDVNTDTAGPINARVYLHQSVTRYNQLTAVNNTPADWCTIACLTGTGEPANTPSPLAVVNATGTIDLPAGQYLFGIGNGNFTHRYTNGNGGNQTVSDPNLGFDGGLAANTIYSGVLFNPRVINATFHYDVAGSPVGSSPCGATCVAATCDAIGSACGGLAATVYEPFSGSNPWDLSADDVVFSASGGTVSVATVPGTAIVPAVAPDLGLRDDDVSALIPLGFELDAFGVCADAIAVQSNGCIWLGVVGGTDFSESGAELQSQEPRLCAYWNDLRPAAGNGGGTVHVDVLTGAALVTFDQVFLWGTTTPVTFQTEITPTAMTVRYDPGSAFSSSAVVGFHNGVAQIGVPGSDLNGGAVPPVTGVPELTLSCESLPFLGGALEFTLAGIPTMGAVLAEFAPLGAGVPLSTPLFLPGCTQYVSGGATVLGLATDCSERFAIGIPVANGFLGLPIGAQGVALDAAAGRFVASNGVNAVLGNY